MGAPTNPLNKFRIRHLSKRIQALSLINLKSIPGDRVAFGSTVSLEDVDTGEEREFRIVHPEEVDPSEGRISIGSPVGQALSGNKEDDEVTIRLPSGARTYVITGLTTIHDQDD